MKSPVLARVMGARNLFRRSVASNWVSLRNKFRAPVLADWLERHGARRHGQIRIGDPFLYGTNRHGCQRDSWCKRTLLWWPCRLHNWCLLRRYRHR